MILDPILSPPRSHHDTSMTRICLDPNHDGIDPSNRVNSHQKKTYTLLLAQKLTTQLTHARYKVTLTRNSDKFIELPDHTEITKKHNADLFISLHFNSTPNSASTVHKTKIYCITPINTPSTNTQKEK